MTKKESRALCQKIIYFSYDLLDVKFISKGVKASSIRRRGEVGRGGGNFLIQLFVWGEIDI